MTEKQHNLFFFSLLAASIILILSLKPPLRNYIPMIWGVLGFGLHGFWLWSTWMKLSQKLISEHKSDLNELKIGFNDKKYNKAIDMFTLIQKRKKIENISDDIKSRLSFYRTYFRLTLIAFPMFAVLGIMTVIMTW